MTDTATSPAGICYGVKAIADFLHVTPRRALYLVNKGAIPSFKEDRTICATRAGLTRVVEEWQAREMTAEGRRESLVQFTEK